MMERGTAEVLLGYPRGWRFDFARKITTLGDGNSLALGGQKQLISFLLGCFAAPAAQNKIKKNKK